VDLALKFDPALLSFSEEGHVYTYDGKPLVSVTEALRRAGMIDATWFTPESRERGRLVHQAVHYVNEAALDWDSVDPRIEGYVRAHERFLKESGLEVIAAELRVAHPLYFFGGTLDLIGWLNGRLMLIDDKTGHPQAWASLQTAGYALCIDEKNIDRRTLWLQEDGRYMLSSAYRDVGDFKVFQAAVACAAWQRNNQR